ncbi:probable F420-dependent oxidoreductase, Rv3093c family [Parafrankia irregularis]|uniref:Probable F420-dependent oxidoreductase, Rv3093c family n=1 Tax=Parafrankia irregularis TaxID=795642 RepID=A0A0S4QR03_9ACTN|nr:MULTISPECIES: LLM class F420-dependent oxidoreductase [Parafrankia]MBE3199877.1 LLM class F420-dependent oxidoreductase [Parafrankia sp. CH37]CUU58032.1 probable F420-dependent oxidoreductase, Rv3093c family [Parafrankia irregularis]
MSHDASHPLPVPDRHDPGAAVRAGLAAPSAPAVPVPVRWGITLPLAGVPLREHQPIVTGLAAAGYTDVWTAEGGGLDAFTPLAVAAAWAPQLRLASAIVPVHTRGPAVIAQTAATLADLTSGGLVLGIGSSVAAHVTDINGIEFTEPFKRTRDVLRFLTRVFDGEVVSGAFDTFAIRGFALRDAPRIRPKVILGALRPRMLRLGFAEGDGVVTNMLFARDVPTVLGAVGPQPAGKELVVKVFVCPVEDPVLARRLTRPFLAWILNQEPYHAFHEWLGNGDLLAASYQRYLAGDAAGAERELPDEVVDGLFVHGTPEECRRRIAEYVQPGVTAIQLYLQAPRLGTFGGPRSRALAGAPGALAGASDALAAPGAAGISVADEALALLHTLRS